MIKLVSKDIKIVVINTFFMLKKTEENKHIWRQVEDFKKRPNLKSRVENDWRGLTAD